MASSWLPLFKRPTVPFSNGDNHPLLPTNGSRTHGEYDDDQEEIELEMRRFASDDKIRPGWARWLRKYWHIVLIFGVIALLFMAALNSRETPRRRPKRRGPARDHWNVSNAKIDALFSRQSTTLAQATARYSLRNNRPPPPMYDKWFEYARAHSCLIDEYEQISRDFEPFYQLAKEDPTYFKRIVDKGSPIVQSEGRGMKTGVFAGHAFRWTDEAWTLYPNDWARTFERFQAFIPDMPFIINGRDEPRSVFNYRLPENTRAKALGMSDPTPFHHSPRPTDKYFKDELKCLVPMREKGFAGLANDASAFMLFASSTELTTDLVPILSMTKITPCFGDILVPSEFYYSDSGWAPRYPWPNNITWDNKQDMLYWRGMTSGGWIYGDNYHSFPRFRLIDIARKNRDLMNVKLTGFHDSLCGDGCNADAVKKEYDVTGSGDPREEVYKYKYLFDVDGNSFSGRYQGLLRSGSLVFKSTVFTEYFNDWLRPFEHYIPVLPDLSDLIEKLEWAVEHNDEARAIQQAGQAMAERVLTDGQSDCYFSLVMLEWARLYGMGVPEKAVPGDVDLPTD